MGTVVAGATVSLDGYIAGPNGSGSEHLFAWFAGGDRTFPSSDPAFQIRLTEPDYQWMRDVNDGIGVSVIGRRMFDLVDGWGGRHPFDKPIVVVTHSVPEGWIAAHPDAPFTFVTDGLPAALERARAIAGELDVDVTAGKIASQCLELACSTHSGSTSCPCCSARVCAVPRRTEGSADPPRWAGPARRGVSRHSPAVPGPRS